MIFKKCPLMKEIERELGSSVPVAISSDPSWSDTSCLLSYWISVLFEGI